MEEKLDLILQKLDHMNSDIDHMKSDIDHMKSDIDHMKFDIDHLKFDIDHLKKSQYELQQSHDEMRLVVNAIKESQDISRSRIDYLEDTQKRQQRVLEILSYKSVEQENDFKDLKRLLVHS